MEKGGVEGSIKGRWNLKWKGDRREYKGMGGGFIFFLWEVSGMLYDPYISNILYLHWIYQGIYINIMYGTKTLDNIQY